MHDVLDIIKNVESIYDSNTSFNVLKDFERVLDELDLYVYENWEDGELAVGPKIDRHWITCSFIWDRDQMPDPMGAKRLTDYDCKVTFKKDSILVPRKIEKPEDMRPGTKKGKLDRKPVWLVEIQMPISLIGDIYGGTRQEMEQAIEPAVAPNPMQEPQDADMATTGTDEGATI